MAEVYTIAEGSPMRKTERRCRYEALRPKGENFRQQGITPIIVSYIVKSSSKTTPLYTKDKKCHHHKVPTGDSHPKCLYSPYLMIFYSLVT